MSLVIIADTDDPTNTGAYLWFPETKRKTLEEIAAAFGDRVVTLTEQDVVAEHTVFEEKAKANHVEEDLRNNP